MRALAVGCLAVLLVAAAAAQPAVDDARLPNTRFSPESGQVLFGQSNWSPEGDDVLIVPPDDLEGITRASAC